MAREASQPRFVKCPRCLRLLMEIADVPVYKCGVCGTILQAKVRHADLQRNPSCSTSETSSRGDESNDLGDHQPCGANAEMEASSPPELPYPAGQPPATEVDTISVVSCPQSQLDGYGMHSKHGSVNSLELTESVISEEEVLDEIPGSTQIRNPVPSIGRSSHSSELGASSGGDISDKHERYRRLSRRTFSNRNSYASSGGGATDRNEVESAGKNQTAPPIPNEMPDACSVGISGLKQRSSSGNYAPTSEPDDHSRSGGFSPLQSGTESDHLSSASRSPSRDSTSTEGFASDTLGGISSNKLGNLQRDREVEQLMRDRSAKSYAGGWRDDRRIPVGGSRHDGHRLPVFSNPISERASTALYNGDMPRWQWRKPAAERDQPQGATFPANGGGSRLHHHPEGRRVPAHCRPWSPQAYFHHPSAAASSGFSDLDRDVSLGHSGESSDHHRGKLLEKRQHRKRRHCRPVSGAAPFVVCNQCSELLQLPVDFLISRGRLHKLRCGACSEVLTFICRGGQIAPHHAGVQELSDPRPSQDTLHEDDPVSCSEENGPPPSQSYSTDGEPSTMRSSPEEKGKGRHEQQMGGPPLHHLLGSPGDVHVQGREGTGRTSPAVGNSPNHWEMEEQQRPAPGVRSGSRGRPSVHRFVRGYAEELAHGLETMKLRSNRNRRSSR